ncbi:MAG TPA: response regulator [Candidatus Aquilonibacter sp.]|nr:response regulator [Candidatus Aquilonibacter sp.]
MNEAIHILYLEDAPNDAVRVETALRQGGLAFRLQRADTEAEFLRGLEPPPDVILSDHGLPTFDGLTALGAARGKCPGVPFIFVTNALTREMEIEKLVGGVTDYVRKSQLDYLPTAVRHALHEVEEHRSRMARFKEFFRGPTGEERRFLPICSCCKKIRDEQNQWKSPEIFFLEYLNLKFTHSLCPDCAVKFLPEK